MNPILSLLLKHYNITHSITESKKFNKTEYRVNIIFEPKEVFYLTPREVSSLSIFNVYSDDSVEFYDMWYVTKTDIPLLGFFHSLNELDKWLEEKSKSILHEELNWKS
jgi:hypothetical protein